MHHVLLLTCAHCGEQAVLQRLFQSPKDVLAYLKECPPQPGSHGEPATLTEALDMGATGAEVLARLTGQHPDQLVHRAEDYAEAVAL